MVMRALEIALTMVEGGGGLSADEVRRFLFHRVVSGEEVLFLYGNVVFSLAFDGQVHLYSLGGGAEILRASRQFLRDTAPRSLWMATVLPGVKSLARRMGWRSAGPYTFGAEKFVFERNDHA